MLAKMCRVGLFGLYGSLVFLAGILCASLSSDEEYATYQVCTNTLVLPEHLDRLWHARHAHTPRWASD